MKLKNPEQRSQIHWTQLHTAMAVNLEKGEEKKRNQKREIIGNQKRNQKREIIKNQKEKIIVKETLKREDVNYRSVIAISPSIVTFVLSESISTLFSK